MPRNRISLETKQRIIDAYGNGHDYVEVARVLGVARGTAWSIVRRHQLQGVVERPRGGARNSKVDQEMTEACVAIVEQHVEFTLSQINHELRLQLPNKPRVCISTISKTLHGQLIHLKKMETVAVDRNRQDIKLARREFAEWLVQAHGAYEEIIYIDESGFNLWLARTRGRAHVGQRAVRIVGARKGPNFTCILTISNMRGVLHREFREGGTRGEHFVNFITTAAELAGDAAVATFVLDNAPCHRAARNADIGNHVIRFLPAYSPMLNIVENAWASWKAAFKRELAAVRPQLLEQEYQQRLATLVQLGEQNLHVITLPKVVRWYRKTLTYMGRCLQLEDIVQDHA